MKKCPYCAEEIQDDAIVCRFCNRELTTKAKVNFLWGGTLFGLLSKMDLYVDEKLVGKASYAKDFIFDVKSGEHEFYIKINYFRSSPLKLNCEAGKTVYLIGGSKQRTAQGTMIRGLFKKDDTFFLEEYKGKV